MSDFSIVSCAEEAWARRENLKRGEVPVFSTVLRCAWNDRYELMADLLLTPRSYPAPAFALVFATSASAVPVMHSRYTEDGQECVFEEALVTVNYGGPGNGDDEEGGVIISESLEPTVEFLTLDYKNFCWGSKTGDPLLEAEAQGIQIRGHVLTRQLYNLPLVPVSYLDLDGTVNDVEYSSVLLGLTYPEETLLFTPGTISRQITMDGTEGFTANLKFTYKKNGWNKYWRAKTQAYEEIFVREETDPYKSYPPDDFSDWLF